MNPTLLIYSIAVVTVFILGACVGSFLNVLIDRLPQTGLSIVRPRSFCMSCKRAIAWRDLIPIVSWCILKGRCRYCGTSISSRILMVELISGLFALICFFRFDAFSGTHSGLLALDAFIFASILLAVMIIDWNHWIIPLPLAITLAFNGILFRGFIFHDSWLSIAGAALLALVFFSGLLLISTWLMRRSGRIGRDETALGWGDVWLSTALGFNVGIVWFPWIIVFASIQAIAAWVVMISLEKYAGMPEKIVPNDIPRNAIPLGTFLALAAIEAKWLIGAI